MAFTASTWGQGRLLTGLSPGSSLSGFTAVITKANLPTSALDTGSLSCLNGGGDWRFSTDINGSTQLPCEIFTCVTNATAGNTEFVAWVRFPTYASGTRSVYAFWNKAGQSQPLVGAAFGRNAAWVDFRYISHDGFTDSTGNSTITFPEGTPTVGTGPLGSPSVILNGTDQYGRAGISSSLSTSHYYSSWIKQSSLTSGVALGESSSSDAFKYQAVGVNGTGNATAYHRQNAVTVEAVSTSSITTNVWYEISASFVSDISRSAYVNGSNKGTNTTSITASGAVDRRTYGRNDDSSPSEQLAAEIAELWLSDTSRTDDFIGSKYDNQNNPSTFWTAGAVFVPGGTTITVTGTTANYTYAAINGTVELTGTISVTGATPNYTYAAIAGTIELTPQITVTGATPNYTYTAISGTVESVGIISVTGATPNYAYTAISGDITLLGTITVTGDTPNYSYSAIRGTIQLGDGVYANSFIGFTPSQGTFNGIVKSSSFNGIINETSDFSGIVKSTTFLGVKE
jgi:hypothetical protein